MRLRRTTTAPHKLLASVVVVAAVAGIAAASGPKAASGQASPNDNESICAELFGFAAEPVPVVKSADGQTVLASVKWGYSPELNICYLILDDTATITLRANPPSSANQSPTAADAAAASECHNAYNPSRGFAFEPVPVVKSADGQTVLASVEWGYSSDHDICFLILDNAAQLTLRAHHACQSNPSSPECTSTQGPNAQELRHALTALYNATGGRNWSNRTNWNTQEPVDTWYGIHTDLDTGVPNSALVLSNNNLTGSIPPKIGNLTQLSELWLYGNRLTGTIPEEVGNLTGLTVLNLGDNNFSGPIPNSLTALTNLEHFYVGGRNLCLPPDLEAWHNAIPNRGTIPPCATPEFREALIALYNATGGPNWTNNTNWNTNKPVHTWHGIRPNANTGEPLSVLFLPNNNLTGTIPPEIGHLTQLTELWLYENDLTGTIPEEIGNLTDLTVLNISDNNFSGPISNSLSALTNLEHFYVGGRDLCLPPELEAWHNAIPNRGAIPPCATPEFREALIALYNATGGPNWTNNTNWNTNKPVHTWHGIYADSNGEFTTLSLNGNNLNGSIPEEIGNLTSLTRIRLDENSLTGTLPLSVADLSGLKQFFVGGNTLCKPPELNNWYDAIQQKHRLPDCATPQTRHVLAKFYGTTDGPNWTNNTNWNSDVRLRDWYGISIATSPSGSYFFLYADDNDVTWLKLHDNNLTGPIPPEIGNLTRLNTLWLQYNRLTGPIPPEIGNLTYLATLYLNNNRLTGPIPPEIGNLTRLNTLWLDNNRLTGPIPPEIGNLTELTGPSPTNPYAINFTGLYLHNNDLTGPIPPEIGNLTKLTELRLQYNRLTGPIPPEIGNLTQLTTLQLYNNNLTGPIPLSFAALTELEHFNTGGNDLCLPGELRAWHNAIPNKSPLPAC